MFRFSIVLLATVLCASCVSHRPIQDSSSPPIDAANPLDGTPAAVSRTASPRHQAKNFFPRMIRRLVCTQIAPAPPGAVYCKALNCPARECVERLQNLPNLV